MRLTFALAGAAGLATLAALAASTGTWSLVATPNVTGVDMNVFTGVSCSGPSDCWAVGYAFARPGESPQQATLFEHWDGARWTLFPSQSTVKYSDMTDVSCVATADCWAVGYTGNGNAPDIGGSLVLHWDGSAWAEVAAQSSSTINAAFGSDRLFAVTCLSSSDCWAVGDYSASGNYDQKHTLAEHWDGRAWKIVASPSVTGSGNYNPQTAVTGLSCVATNDCWAVGFYTKQDYDIATFTEHWDGATWSVISSRNYAGESGVGDYNNGLSRVSCASHSDCWSVGVYFGTEARDPTEFTESFGSLNEYPLVQHWDGSNWTIATVPTVSGRRISVNDITCTSTFQCWAVGTSYLQDTYQQTLVERWDGNAWSIFSSPNQGAPNTQHNGLAAVTCPTSIECWSVGLLSSPLQSNGSNFPYMTLALHYLAPDTPPVVSAGPDVTANAGTLVQLHATASDADAGDTLRYRWVQVLAPGDPIVVLAGADTLDASFAAPVVTRDTALVFRFTAADAYGGSASDEVAVSIPGLPAGTGPVDPGPAAAGARAADGNNHVGGALSPMLVLLLGLSGLLRSRACPKPRPTA